VQLLGAEGLEKAWWERRYREGRPSGPGSVGRGRAWKWKVITEYAGGPRSVVDVGCGDLSFWEDRDCPDYTGIDIACNIIAQDRVARPDWVFICANAAEKQSVGGDVVLCLDLLFHIMNTDDFKAILRNLCSYSERWIFVYTWTVNPFTDGPNSEMWRARGKTVTDDRFQYYRPLRDYLPLFNERGFKLVEARCPPWGGIGELFVFKKNRAGSGI